MPRDENIVAANRFAIALKLGTNVRRMIRSRFIKVQHCKPARESLDLGSVVLRSTRFGCTVEKLSQNNR